MTRWPHERDNVPHDPSKEVVVCKACGGTGCNRWVTPLTQGMRAACPQCDGAGFDEAVRT
jgi:DnaJ-class molecular chaperone